MGDLTKLRQRIFSPDPLLEPDAFLAPLTDGEREAFPSYVERLERYAEIDGEATPGQVRLVWRIALGLLTERRAAVSR